MIHEKQSPIGPSVNKIFNFILTNIILLFIVSSSVTGGDMLQSSPHIKINGNLIYKYGKKEEHDGGGERGGADVAELELV